MVRPFRMLILKGSHEVVSCTAGMKALLLASQQHSKAEQHSIGVAHPSVDKAVVGGHDDKVALALIAS